MEKVLCVRVRGTDWVDGKEIVIGELVYRFIGNDEVESAEKQLLEYWKYYADPKASPYMLYINFERIDVQKELRCAINRGFIDDNPDEAKRQLMECIVKAVEA